MLLFTSSLLPSFGNVTLLTLPCSLLVSFPHRTFYTLNLLQLNIFCAIRFAIGRSYLNILVGIYTIALSLTMLIVAVEAPKMATDRLERSKLGEQLFSFRGRYMADLIIALFLFAMSPLGIVLGVLTLLLIFGIRFLGVKQPDAFNEIFRQSDVESQADSYTLESEYDTPVSERR
jgi:hypothetical protein